MKRIIATIIGLSMVSMIFVGCSSKDGQNAQQSNSSTPGSSTDSVKPAQNVELVIESWRADDVKVWQDVILPAYEKTHEGVKIKFNGVINTEYGTTLQTKLKAKSAGDIIMVEPYDFRSSLYADGYLEKLNDLEGANTQSFDEFALSAWSTDSGDLFGLPLASVIHGFIYNKNIFKELNLEIPKTVDEFLAVLKKVQESKKYTPIAMGTGSDFVTSVLGYSVVVPNFVNGEEGRQGLINGTKKFTDAGYVEAWEFLNNWVPYMPEGYEAVTYPDMQNLFISGQAAIFPAGSWEFSIFDAQIKDSFEYGVFPVPTKNAGDPSYVCNHPDMGLALNADSPNKEQAKAFLTWTTTGEFAEIWNNALPGLYTLSKNKVDIKNPLANEMLAWTQTMGSTPRIAYQYLSRGDFNTDAEIIRLTTLMLNKKLKPAEVAAQIQEGLEKSYKPVK